MKKFVLLSYGFKTPTPEIMSAWNTWFESIKGSIVEMAGLGGGVEISKAGAKTLPMDLEAITGLVIVHAKDLAEAQKMAASNPYITSIRVYEVRGK